MIWKRMNYFDCSNLRFFSECEILFFKHIVSLNRKWLHSSRVDLEKNRIINCYYRTFYNVIFSAISFHLLIHDGFIPLLPQYQAPLQIGFSQSLLNDVQSVYLNPLVWWLFIALFIHSLRFGCSSSSSNEVIVATLLVARLSIWSTDIHACAMVAWRTNS